MGENSNKILNECRSRIKKVLNANDDDYIIFTSSGSEANNLALNEATMPYYMTVYDGNSHSSIINRMKDRWDCNELKCNNKGLITKDNIKSIYNKLNDFNIFLWAADDSTLENIVVVSICMANNEIGTIQNMNEIISQLREYASYLNNIKLYIHGDAVQYICDKDIDLQKLDVDMLTISGHKIGTPSGIAMLYVKKGTPITPLVYGEQQYGFHGGTENIPYILGLTKALELLKPDRSKPIREKQKYFISLFSDEIKSNKVEIVGIYDLEDFEAYRLSNNINLLFKGVDAQALMMYLDRYEIMVSTGSACNSRNMDGSHVLKNIGINEVDLHSCIRFTISQSTSMDQLEYVYNVIKNFYNVYQDNTLEENDIVG